jgi:hypothetical protein
MGIGNRKTVQAEKSGNFWSQERKNPQISTSNDLIVNRARMRAPRPAAPAQLHRQDAWRRHHPGFTRSRPIVDALIRARAFLDGAICSLWSMCPVRAKIALYCDQLDWLDRWPISIVYRIVVVPSKQT